MVLAFSEPRELGGPSFEVKEEEYQRKFQEMQEKRETDMKTAVAAEARINEEHEQKIQNMKLRQQLKACKDGQVATEPHKELDIREEQIYEAEQQDEQKEPSLTQEPVSSVTTASKKRKIITMTPFARTSILVKGLQTLFHFFIHVIVVERICDMSDLPQFRV